MSLDWIPEYREGQQDGTKESEVVQCFWLEDLQHSIGEPGENRGGIGGRRHRRTARSKGQREKI